MSDGSFGLDTGTINVQRIVPFMVRIHFSMTHWPALSKLLVIFVAGILASGLTRLNGQGIDAGHAIANDLRSGQYEKARVSAERALRSSPRDARLWTLKGLALIQLGDRTGALTCFTSALEIAPDYLPALQGAAQMAYQTDPVRAVPFLRKILQLRPDDQTSHAMLAEIAVKTGDCETARKESAMSQPGLSETAALKQFGGCLVKQKRMLEAISVFKRLTALQPDEQSFYYLGLAQFLAGQFRDVIRTLTPAVEKQPGNTDLLELLAEAYDFTSEPERAISTLKRAIAAKPDTPDYYTDFAYLCQAHGWFQQGIQMLNTGLERLPQAAPLYVARGVLHSELSQWAEGEADFQRASEIDPNVELGSAAQGLAELQENDLVKAEKTARERLRQHPDDAFSYYVLAEVLTKRGATPGSSDFEEALRAAQRAVELKPNLWLARNVLARLYLAQGKADGAAAQSRIVYEANPNDQAALYHLILALRKAGGSPELPELLKQLAQLKERSRKQDGLGHKAESLFPTWP